MVLPTRLLVVVGGTTALVCWGLLILTVQLLPRSIHPETRRRTGYDVINYLHSLVGFGVGVAVLASGQIPMRPILSRSDLLDIGCAMTLGYLVVDCIPIYQDPRILVRDSSDQFYHIFHLLIVAGFGMYLCNGTGGLVAAAGLVSELDTVFINQNTFWDWMVLRGSWRARPVVRRVSLLLEFGVRAVTRGAAFLILSFMCWLDIYRCSRYGCNQAISGPASLAVVVVQVAVVHVATVINLQWCKEQYHIQRIGELLRPALARKHQQ